jgi:hypothetical protein
MIKAILLLDCDNCRALFAHSKLVSNDQSALVIHGETLMRQAESEGWSATVDRNTHFCESCSDEIEMMMLANDN